MGVIVGVGAPGGTPATERSKISTSRTTTTPTGCRLAREPSQHHLRQLTREGSQRPSLRSFEDSPAAQTLVQRASLELLSCPTAVLRSRARRSLTRVHQVITFGVDCKDRLAPGSACDEARQSTHYGRQQVALDKLPAAAPKPVSTSPKKVR